MTSHVPLTLTLFVGMACTLAAPALGQDTENSRGRAAGGQDSQQILSYDQTDEYDPDSDDNGRRFRLDELDVGFRWLTPASIDGGSGDVGMTRFGSALSFEYKFANEFEISVGGEYLREDWYYDGEGSGLLPGTNKPWDGFHRYGLEIGASAPVGKWEFLGEIGFEWAEELNASTSDSMLLEGFVAARRQIWDNFDIVLGVFYGQSFEDDDEILPLIGFNWRITDVDTLSLSRPREGYQLLYRRELNDQWSVQTYGRFVNEEFRLDRDGPTNGGALASEEYQIGVGAEYEFGPGRAGIDVGYSFGREYTVFSNTGSTIAEPQLDGAFSVGLFYTIGF